MPTYPGSPEITVDALLQRPQLLVRQLTDLVYQRFVADAIFTRGGPGQVTGGAVWYQRAESIFLDRDPEEVGVRSEFPRAGWTEEVFSAFVHKYGLEVPIAYESIRRNQIDQVARAQRKLANGLVRFVDTMAIDFILADTDLLGDSATGHWGGGSDDIIKDLASARTDIENQNQGYVADTVVMSPTNNLQLLLNEDIRNALPRETSSGSIQTGRPVPILGFDNMIVTPQMPDEKVLVCQSKVFGTVADEQPDASEGYSTYNAGGGFATLFVKVYNNENRDERIIRCARFPAMWISEPKAAYVIDSVQA